MPVLPRADYRLARSARRRRLLMPLVVWAVLALGLGYLFLNNSSEPAPSAPMGASVPVPGGMASIIGVTPLEETAWQPPKTATLPPAPPQDGAHWVRVQVQFTALEASGVHYDSARYFVDGIGSGQPKPLWSSPQARDLEQGESLTATMLFELPDKAIALVLENEAGSRLSLGSDHHSGG